jgi:hypothetical protein
MSRQADAEKGRHSSGAKRIRCTARLLQSKKRCSRPVRSGRSAPESRHRVLACDVERPPALLKDRSAPHCDLGRHDQKPFILAGQESGKDGAHEVGKPLVRAAVPPVPNFHSCPKSGSGMLQGVP